MQEQRDEVGLMSGQLPRAGGCPAQVPSSASETAEMLHKTPALFSYRVRCGKSTCRCARGEGHGPYWFLYWREGTVQRRRYVPAAEVAAVRTVVEARRVTEQAERLVLGQSLETWRGMRRWLRELKTTGRR